MVKTAHTILRGSINPLLLMLLIEPLLGRHFLSHV
jgi:hypothetical protein